MQTAVPRIKCATMLQLRVVELSAWQHRAAGIVLPITRYLDVIKFKRRVFQHWVCPQFFQTAVGVLDHCW
jgi:hypothetical protein